MDPLRSFAEFERFLGEFTNYERSVQLRYDKETLGLSRIRALTDALGRPQDAFPSVHVAGTKGKGCTTLILEALLEAAGKATGAYTSPHVEHICERIRVRGANLSPEALVEHTNEMLPALEQLAANDQPGFPSFFELMTALAMLVFRSTGVDWGLVEVGLGGRLDATNILAPRFAIITSIDLEHTAQLGSTLGEIAREKAGIVKPGVPVFVGPLPREAEVVVRAIARERGAEFVAVDPSELGAEGSTLTLDRLGGFKVDAPAIRGPALRTDVAIALRVFEAIAHETGESISPQVVANAFAGLDLPARVELFPGSPPVVLDSAHTPGSMMALERTLEELGIARPRTAVFSLAQGKNRAPVFDVLARIADRVIFTTADAVRSVPPETLRAEFGAGEVVESPDAALDAALAAGRPVVVTGSFYLSGRIRGLVRRAGSKTKG